MTPRAMEDAISKLCPKCGLCCNGVLFSDVELERGDEPQRLAELGLAFHRKGKKNCLPQPCACLDGTLCRIYANRPERCRTFECRLLQRVQAGSISSHAALKAIRQAHQCADAVRLLVRKLGQHDEHLPLSKRYHQIMAEPIDLAGDEEMADLRGQLMLAVHELVQTLEKDFLT